MIVRLIEPTEQTGLLDIVIGSLGLAGAILLAAVLFGLVLAGVLFWLRSRER